MQRVPLLLLFAGGLATTGSAQDAVSVFGGAQVTAGRYGGDRAVSTVGLSLGTMATRGRWRLWAALPYLFQDAATVRTVGAGMLPVGGATHSGMNGTLSGTSGGMMGSGGMGGLDAGGSGMTGHSGPGDPLLRADATIWESTGSSYRVGMYSAVKVPLARASSGFGTGRWDEAIGGTFARLERSFSLLADLSYWHLGRVTGDPIRDVSTGTLTVARALGTTGQHLYGSLIATTPFASGAAAPMQLVAGWSHRGADRRTFAVTAGAGLTPTAPAVSLSATWQWGLR